MSRWLTPYHLGGLAILVILGIGHGSLLRSLDELVWTVALTVTWAAIKDIWQSWTRPERAVPQRAEVVPPSALGSSEKRCDSAGSHDT